MRIQDLNSTELGADHGGSFGLGNVCPVRLPATLNEVVAAVELVFADGAARSREADRRRALGAWCRSRVDPDETLARVLDGDELPLVLPLGEGRHVQLPAMIEGRMFAHWLGSAEIEHGYLNVSPYLDPVAVLTDNQT